jgi:two-component system chemotaxis sensor kinase CheA
MSDYVDEDKQEMIRDFVTEGRELLDDAEPQIIEMEKMALASGRVDGEVLNGIFRLFHSLKGTASFLDFQAIISVTHEAETLLDIFRKGRAAVTPYQVDLLCRTTDFVRSILDVVERQQSDEGFEEEASLLVEDLMKTMDAISSDDGLPRQKDKGRGETGLPDPGGPAGQQAMEAIPGEVEPPERQQPSGEAISMEPVQDLDLPAGSQPVPFQAAGPRFDLSALEQDFPIGEGYTPAPNLEKMGIRITPEMIRNFVEEALELCEDAETALLSLEKMPDKESAGQAFRAFHSIKGNAGFLGYGDLEQLSHLAENLLDRVRSGERGCNPAAMSALLKVIDAVRGKVNGLAGGGGGEIPDLVQLCESLENLAQGDQGLSRSDTAPPSSLAEELEELTGGKEPPTGAKQAGVLSALFPEASVPEDQAQPGEGSAQVPSLAKELEQLMTGQPPAEIPRPGLAGQLETPAMDASSGACLHLDRATAKPPDRVPSPADLAVTGEPPEDDRENPPELAAGHVRSQRGPVANLLDAEAPDSRTAAQPDAAPGFSCQVPAPGAARPAPPASGTPVGSGVTPGSGTVIRVDIEKLDKMLDLVGELVIAESMVANNQEVSSTQNDKFSKAVQQLDKISREIQEVAMSMRMIPLAGVFRKMVRLVRDLAQKADKQVDLVIAGEETEVDKTLIEQISDPLVHLIRNAVDHGIEPVAERITAGKPETGRVTLEAKHSAGEVWITVEDDGKGLDRDKIFQKGVEKGLIRAEDKDLKDEEIWRLIFEPGFSTAERVSSISGRGVGMDVVKRNIEHLRGKVDIRSRAGAGTVFAVRIPLTLAIIEGMMVRVGVNRYIIPISSIKESFRPDPGQITRLPDGLEIVRIRGELQPVLRLHEIYRGEPGHHQLTGGILIMVENGENKCCLFVDEILGQQQIVIKGLPGYLKHVRGVSGCAILGDGEISMILDIADLVNSVDDIVNRIIAS